MTDHPITPPPELVRQWMYESNDSDRIIPQVAAFAAQWGADQELEACCKWLNEHGYDTTAFLKLRTARRPKPPSLKEYALATLHSMQIEPCMINGVNTIADLMAKYDILRRALEALPND